MSLQAPQPHVRKARAVPSRGEGEGSKSGQEQRAEDHASIRLAIAGDERGFSDLYERYERRAWRVARNLVPSDEDAHDLVQDAFMRVFRNFDRFDFSHAFSTWLYRIVTNLAIDHLRKRRMVYSTTSSEEGESEQELLDERMEDPSAALVREETVGEVRACLEALAPHFQSALVLRELEGLPCNDIADIVGATHVTVRWRLHRGRKLFQEEWERREREREIRGGSNGRQEQNVRPDGQSTGAEASPDFEADPSQASGAWNTRAEARGAEPWPDQAEPWPDQNGGAEE